jgi:exosome complex component RRP41
MSPVIIGRRSVGGANRTTRRTSEMQHTLSSAFQSTCLTHLYPHSTITLTLHILSQDGSLLATCLNASTLALIDAGIPMTSYIASVTVATTASYADKEEDADPLLDVNGTEELELPFLTLAIAGEGDGVAVLVLETRVQVGRLEGMVAVGLDGCRQVGTILDGVVRAHGKRLIEGKVG